MKSNRKLATHLLGFAAIVFCILLPAAAQVLTKNHPAQNPNLNPRALAYVLPSDVHWTHSADGPDTATLLGDPAKPGQYIILVKWLPHRMSHPHFHPYDRHITVLSGTWWVGTGPVYQPDKTVPLPARTFVTHFAHEIHYDGAKDHECIIEIEGMGPAPSIPAEKK